MSDTDNDRLKASLAAKPPSEPGCMSAAELDGYIAAMIVCPVPTMPCEYLPGIWDEDHVFKDGAEAGPTSGEMTADEIMGHYILISWQLKHSPEQYAPLLEIDPDSGKPLWEPWIKGFERAMRLYPDAWCEIVNSEDPHAAAAVGMILTLSDREDSLSELTETAWEELARAAPDLIPKLVQSLNAWTKSRRFEDHTENEAEYSVETRRHSKLAFGRKVGRNEPCPCGSGRKYKRCCSR